MGHADVGTTQGYTDEIELDELQRRWTMPTACVPHERRPSGQRSTLQPSI